MKLKKQKQKTQTYLREVNQTQKDKHHMFSLSLEAAGPTPSDVSTYPGVTAETRKVKGGQWGGGLGVHNREGNIREQVIR